jgi:hypothetical protein
MILLSDGTVMAQQGGTTNQWYKLTPDLSGNYADGTWSQLSSMHVSREYYGSNLLPNGNLLVVGGEYSSAGGDTNTAEIYNTSNNTWANTPSVPTPASQFGDDPTQMLPDGRVLAGYINGPQTYIYDPSTNSWLPGPTKLYNDQSDEESWVKLPDGSILTYDIFASLAQNHLVAERFVPSQNQWVDASHVDPIHPPGLLSDPSGDEIGPATLLPGGRVFFPGANGSTGNTAIYNPSTDTWSAGAPIPYGCTASDVPAAPMPNGDVLLEAWNSNGTHVFEFNPTANGGQGSYTDVTPGNFPPPGVNHPYMLVLPSGQVLMSDDGSNQLDIYTPGGSPNNSWRPTITDIYQQGNGVVLMAGTQLNGISQGAEWGDDSESFSNYPLVQLLGVPFLGNPYLRTSGWSSTGVAEGNQPESVKFQLGDGIDVLMHEIGDGIASPTILNVQMSPTAHNITLRRDPNNPADLEILDSGSYFDDVPFGSFSGVIVTGALNTANTLTVDYASGGFFSAGVTFDGGGALISPSNTLTVIDAGDAQSRSWVVDSDAILATNSGLLIPPVVVYHGIQAVTLDSGGGTVSVLSTSVTTNVVAGGLTTVNVGNGGSAQGIQGTLNIENPPSFNTIVVDDSADPTARSVTLSRLGPNPADSQHNQDPWGQVIGLAPAHVNYEYGDVTSLTIRGGANGDMFLLADVPPAAVILGGTGGTNTFHGTPNERFVADVYLDLLGRPADAAALASWGGQLDQGALTRGQVTAALVGSAEYRLRAVGGFYLSYLHRPADAAGLQAAVAAWAVGATREQLKAMYLGSPEYYALHGGGDTGFVQALYPDALGRPADPAGLAAWVNYLAQGGSRATLALALLQSPEGEQLVVNGLYLRLLHRPADPFSLAADAAALQQGALRDEQLAAGLAASQEYFQNV